MAVTVALTLWPIACWLAFRRWPARRAVLVCVIAGWLFMPNAPAQGFPLYHLQEKFSLVPAVVLFFSLALDPFARGRLRFSWVDLPVLIFCISPIFTSLANDLGFKDGVSTALDMTLSWGSSYLLGRLYFGSERGIRELVVGVFAGGLVYIVPCLWEIRFSPQLHRILYGFATREDLGQAVRFGGYRPTVFMTHGLMVGMWMACASLCGLWLWRSGAVRRLGKLPVRWLVGAQLAATALCKSTGALVLFGIGAALVFAGRRVRAGILAALLLGVPVYQAARISGWRPEFLLDSAVYAGGEDRQSSLRFRIDNEDLFIAKALRRPLFGWGLWGRNFVYDDQGKPNVADGEWVIAFSAFGSLGLLSLTLLSLLPTALFWRIVPPRRWSTPSTAAVAALATFLPLVAVDNIANAMINPVYVLGMGGLASFYLERSLPSSVRSSAPSLAAAEQRLRRAA